MWKRETFAPWEQAILNSIRTGQVRVEKRAVFINNPKTTFTREHYHNVWTMTFPLDRPMTKAMSDRMNCLIEEREEMDRQRTDANIATFLNRYMAGDFPYVVESSTVLDISNAIGVTAYSPGSVHRYFFANEEDAVHFGMMANA